MRKEELILSSLIHNEDFSRKILPFLKEDYFDNFVDRELYKYIDGHIKQYNSLPTKVALKLYSENVNNLNEEQFKQVSSLIESLTPNSGDSEEWLIDQTEQFCQDKAIYNAIKRSIIILDDKDKDLSKDSIPSILQEALGVCFDTSIGHDFIEDVSERFDFYHRTDERVPFDIDILNKITKGGVPNKSLSVIMGGTGTGKSLVMCHMAAANLMDSKNVLYITMEMAEEKIAERIDANTLDCTIEEINMLPKDVFERKINNIRSKTPSKLIIKEYPTASVGSGHFRHLLNELKLKKNFVPDIIYIDYINICLSSRIKGAQVANSYTYVKAIAEELRGLAIEFGVPIVTATQTNRTGFTNDDVGLEDVSESFGLPATADFMFALITNDELEAEGHLMMKQLKNRWGDPSIFRRFLVGIDKTKMKLSNVDYDEPETKKEDTPIMDTNFGPDTGKLSKKIWEGFDA